MEIRLDTKLEIISPLRTKASIHLDFFGGGMTISNILIRRSSTGKWTLTMPLVQIKDCKHPTITLQGALKSAVFTALNEDHIRLREQQKKIYQKSRFYKDDFLNQTNCPSEEQTE